MQTQNKIQFLNDQELSNLSLNSNILIEGLQGLVKVDKKAVVYDAVKVRIGSIISGQSKVSQNSDIGLGGGGIIHNSSLEKNAVLTNGAKILESNIDSDLRNYGAQIRNSRIGKHFIIRSLAEARFVVSGDNCKINIFTQLYNVELGDQNIIGSHSNILNSVIGDNNRIKDYSKLENAIINDNCIIGNYVHIQTKRNAEKTIIGESCRIGNHVIITPGVHITAHSTIPDYAIVYVSEGKTKMSVLDII